MPFRPTAAAQSGPSPSIDTGTEHLRRPGSGRFLLGYTLLVLVLAGVFSAVVIEDFGGPMVGPGDRSLWVHQSYYLARNLSFTPLPSLDLENDQLSYPYPTNNVFQQWILEAHYFSLICTRLFGMGPWEQLYYLVTVIFTALGVFLLLRGEHGRWRAALVGVSLAFCNYYAIFKYPPHFGYTIVHWLTLALVTDYLLVRRLVLDRPWSARLVAARLVLLVLGFGADLGYLCGIGLTSLGCCACWMAMLLALRNRFVPARIWQALGAGGSQLAASFLARRFQVWGLVASGLVAGFLYLPLVLEIFASASAFDFTGVQMGAWWTNPLRLLIPTLQWFDPGTAKNLFGDCPDTVFTAAPGIFFLLAGLGGLIFCRRRILCSVPFIFLLALLLSFHPVHFTLIRALPWFTFARSNGRFSVAFPILLMILSLGIPRAALKRPLLIFLLSWALLAAEAGIAYRLHLSRDKGLARPDQELAELLVAIRNSPGEAVLEWPFCVAAGNGVGSSLGTYYEWQNATSILQVYHGKKIMGKYFGRLHPLQTQSYLAAGWPHLFLPERPGKPTRQKRDFYAHEWEFMESFFKRNDFCGILLYSDRLPSQTISGFYSRFGQPVAEATGVPFGKVQFIPRPPQWAGLVDRAAGRLVTLPRLAAVWPIGRRLEMASAAAADHLGSGWTISEKGFCCSVEPVAELVFSIEEIRSLVLSMSASTVRAQRVVVLLNGSSIADGGSDGLAPRTYHLDLPESLLRRENRLRFELPQAHSPQSLGISDDTRLLGIRIAWMRLAGHRGPPATPGKTIATAHPQAEEYRLDGWIRDTKDCFRSIAPTAALAFSLDRSAPLTLEIEAATYHRQRVQVELNGSVITTITHDGRASSRFCIPLPEQLLGPENILRFRFPDAHSPRSVGIKKDARKFGITLHWFRFLDQPQAPSLGSGTATHEKLLAVSG